MQFCQPYRGVYYITEEDRDVNVGRHSNHSFRRTFGFPAAAWLTAEVLRFTIPINTAVRFESMSTAIYSPAASERSRTWGPNNGDIGHWDRVHIKARLLQPTRATMKLYSLWIPTADIQGWRLRPEYPAGAVVTQGQQPTGW